MRKTKLKGQLIAGAVILTGLAGTASVTTYAAETTEAATSQKFMLRLIPDNDQAFNDELQRRLDAVSRGEQDMTYVTKWKAPIRGSLLQNHIYLRHADTGELKTFVTDAQGKKVETVLEAEVHAALAPVMERCMTHGQNTFAMTAYNARLDVETAAVLSGSYTATCYPGSNSQRKAVSADEHIAGLMASTDLPIESRKASARGMKAGDLRRKFKADFPNPTREESFAHCLESFTILNDGFRYHESKKASKEDLRLQCKKNTERDYPN